jgi:host cell factor
MFVFGGWNGREYFNDLHILDLEIMAWSRPSTSGPGPS